MNWPIAHMRSTEGLSVCSGAAGNEVDMSSFEVYSNLSTVIEAFHHLILVMTGLLASTPLRINLCADRLNGDLTKLSRGSCGK